MARLRRLNTGKWNMPPVLTAARRLLIQKLGRHATNRPLGEMADFVNGTSYQSDLLTHDGTPIIRISNITDPKSTFLKTQQSFEDKYKVDIGDLLVSWSASFKSIIWPGPPAILNQHIFRVRPKPGNDRSYMRHAIEAVFDEMQEKVVGIGMMHLRRQDFLGYEIPCPVHATQRTISRYLDWIESGSNGTQPPLPDFLDEQRRIVFRIEEVSTKLTEANDLRTKALEEIEAMETSLTELCFQKLSENGVPSYSFQEVCERITVGHVSSMRHAYREKGVPFLRSQNVRKNRFEPEGLCFIAREFHEANPKSSLKPGDVGIVRTGFVGVACVIPASLKEANCADLVIVRPGAKLDAEYASRFLNSASGKNRAASASVGSAQKHYNVGAMRRTRIPVPSIGEQRRIVNYLDDLQANIDALKKLQTETAAELDALMPSILSRAFRGEL